jgi:PTH1 family peptidyl-tRNA hydrolase
MSNIFDIFKKIEKENESRSLAPITHIVVGLGNPGDKYATTRHNAGFMFIDWISNKSGVSVNRSKFKSLCGEATVSGKRVILMKPQTMMNASGEAVIEACNFYKIPPEKVIVISDDVTLDVGRLRVRGKGSHGGHNGLKDIIRLLGTDLFPRLRLGVGLKPHPDYDIINWVLGAMPADDIKKMTSNFDAAYAGLEKIVLGDVEGAMQVCNGVK